MARDDLPATTMLDHFAARLSRSFDIDEAARQLGRGRAWGRTQFRKICEELGVPVDEEEERRQNQH